ncbi:MAG TPA: alpha/beta hydrolase [Methylomirabilota bacterium]|nr:alpha/beta hydrolase [Methylomirabilota bacterium]
MRTDRHWLHQKLVAFARHGYECIVLLAVNDKREVDPTIPVCPEKPVAACNPDRGTPSRHSDCGSRRPRRGGGAGVLLMGSAASLRRTIWSERVPGGKVVELPEHPLRKMNTVLSCFPVLVSLCFAMTATGGPTNAVPLLEIERQVTHGYATNDGVRIHYVRLGQGPLVVMIHGFPDCWLTWRRQMPALAQQHEVVAIDQRGYNLSDRPQGAENYDMKLLVADVAAVIRARGRTRAIVVGHDWGGAVAWTFAMTRPEMTEKLIILNLPHPRGLSRELANNPEQRKNSAYARGFQQEGAHTNLTAEGLTFWIKDSAARPRYLEAFRRSDFEAMLNYYKRNYPREPYVEDTSPVVHVQCPVLMIHGLKDTALGHAALNGNWQYVDKDLTLVTVPEADHWVQQDAAEFVTRTMVSWLNR